MSLAIGPVQKLTSNRASARWLMVMLLTSFVALISRLGEITHDAFHEMALFREFWTTGVFPQQDIFAYSETVSPSIHHEWGTGAILYFFAVSTGWGLVGLSVLKGLLVGGLWFCLYRVARLRGAHPILFAAFSLVVFPIVWVGFATIRATLFTLLFIAIQLWMHERDRRGHRLWVVGWWLMLVVWLNVHAGFIVGIGFLAFHAADAMVRTLVGTRSLAAVLRKHWHLVVALSAVPLALPINPYGWKYVTYLMHGLSMPRNEIVEWKPLWYTHEPLFTIAMFSFSVLLLGISLRQSKSHFPSGIAILFVCAIEALKHIRHGAIYGIVWVAYVPAWFSHTRLGVELVRMAKSHPIRIQRVAQVVTMVVGLFAVISQFWISSLNGPYSSPLSKYPTGQVDYLLRHQFHGNLLTPFHAGAYVSWEMFPHVKVSMDGRYEVAYSNKAFQAHVDFFESRDGWSDLIDLYAHDAILINKSAPVYSRIEKLRSDGGQVNLPSAHKWRVAHEDDAYLLLCKDSASLPAEQRLASPQVDRSGLVFSPQPPLSPQFVSGK